MKQKVSIREILIIAVFLIVIYWMYTNSSSDSFKEIDNNLIDQSDSLQDSFSADSDTIAMFNDTIAAADSSAAETMRTIIKYQKEYVYIEKQVQKAYQHIDTIDRAKRYQLISDLTDSIRSHAGR